MNSCLFLSAALLAVVSFHDGFVQGFLNTQSWRGRMHGMRMSSSPSVVKGGSVVAIITPMFPDGSIDYPRFEDLLRWHVKEGTDGAVILGTTGEGSLIGIEERKKVIQTAVEVVQKAFPIIVGTGTIDAKKVIELNQQAKDNGADATLIITPYYVKPPQRALVEHYTSIANAVDIPIILYNCPGRTGVDLKPETIGQLSKHDRIIGVKDATGDLDRIASIRSVTSPNFLIYSGEDDSGVDFVRLGGDGVISVTANIAPGLMHKMLALSKSGSRKEAEAINEILMPLHKRLFLESNPIPTKKALQIMGKIDSGIRPPLTNLAPEHIQSIQEALIIAKAV